MHDREGALERGLSRAADAARLLRIYGVRDGAGLVARLLTPRGVVSFTDGGRRWVMPNDRSAHYHLLQSVSKLRRLAEHVRPDDRMIVDVGAHAGLFSAFALERAPTARALLVEPNPALRPIIESNLGAARHWELATAAISDAVGETMFHRSAKTQESSLIKSTIRSGSEPMTVPTTTLDELCARFAAVDVLKIDVQGAEHLVLVGGRATLPKVRTLLIEISFADPDPASVLAELTASFGRGRMINPVYAGADLLFER